MTARYQIEVNVARKGRRPVWRILLDENDGELWWNDKGDAEIALQIEARGDNARIVEIPQPLEYPRPIAAATEPDAERCGEEGESP
jgi:hypothetical protein